MDNSAQRTPIIAETLAQLKDSSDGIDAVINDPSTDIDVYRAAEEQKGEIEDRISTLENLQLVKDTEAMEDLMPQIRQAKSDLDDVLAKISKASDVVDGVTKFLDVVDALVVAAKAVA